MANKKQEKLPFQAGYGKNIIKIRKALLISQEELGKIIGCGPSVIGAIENEERYPTIGQLKALLENFDVSLDYLIGRSSVSSMSPKKIKEKCIICNLKSLIQEDSINISKLSKSTGISRTTLTDLSYNRAKGIQFDTLKTLCEYFSCDVSDLLTIGERATP